MSSKILITPKSYGTYKSKAYPLILEKGYEIIENTFGRTMTEQEILEITKKDVVGIIVGVDPITSIILQQSKDLIAVSKYGVGMDNIDLEKAKELGINVKNAVGTNSISVAEQTIALMFSITRNIPSISKDVKDGGWDRVIGCELTDKRLGIIGGGQIGKEVAKRARGLEMRVSIYDPYFNDEAFLNKYEIEISYDLSQLFIESDIISLHIPATSETKGIINKKTLKLMKPTSYIINTSRGELINEADLFESLSSNAIAGAAQDVFSCEPPVKGEKLLELDNFILTSHIGAFTREAVERMVMVSTFNLLDMLEEKKK